MRGSRRTPAPDLSETASLVPRSSDKGTRTSAQLNDLLEGPPTCSSAGEPATTPALLPQRAKCACLGVFVFWGGFASCILGTALVILSICGPEDQIPLFFLEPLAQLTIGMLTRTTTGPTQQPPQPISSARSPHSPHPSHPPMHPLLPEPHDLQPPPMHPELPEPHYSPYSPTPPPPTPVQPPLLPPSALLQQSSQGCQGSCDAVGRCIPTVYILGAQKAGSTALWQIMTWEGFCSSQPQGKESHYLDRSNATGVTRLGYSSLFLKQNCPSMCFLEATPNYLSHFSAPRSFAAITSSLERQLSRFIVSLREPFARDLSWFNHKKELLHEQGTCAYCTNVMGVNYAEYVDRSISEYEACLPSLEVSMMRYWRCGTLSFAGNILAGAYWPQLQDWYSQSPTSQYFIFQYEWMFKDPHKFQERLYNFLGIPKAHIVGSIPMANQRDFSGKLSSASVPCATIQHLRNVWDPWNEKLFQGYPHLDRNLWSLPARCA